VLYDAPLQNKQQKEPTMDYLTIILLTAATAGLVGLAWLSGYEFGSNDATNSERALANQRVNGLLAELNKLKPRANSKRRARK
jgi:hypothetical protein